MSRGIPVPMPIRPRRKRHAIVLLSTVLAIITGACGGDEETPVVEGVIDRETFIQVYVDLRNEAVRDPDLTLSDEARVAVLTRHGVDESDLMAFVDAYGRNLDYMNDVWTEVEQRVEALPPVPRDGSSPGV